MRYAAIGDSFTEGVGDVLPDGGVRGWADRVAAGLGAALAERGEPVEYANFAIRGRLLRPIVDEQLEAALALDPLPDLVTLNGGGNDMLRPVARLDELLALTTRAIERCAETGVRLVLLSGADPTGQLPFGGMVHRRGVYLTDGLAGLCEKHGVTLVNVFGDQEIRDPRYWSADRLHLAPQGHARVAGLVLHALGHAPLPDPDRDPAPAAAPQSPPAAPAELSGAAGQAPRRGRDGNARYYREHVVPWIRRRLNGTSSGDGRRPKHPVWHPIAPPERESAA